MSYIYVFLSMCLQHFRIPEVRSKETGGDIGRGQACLEGEAKEL